MPVSTLMRRYTSRRHPRDGGAQRLVAVAHMCLLRDNIATPGGRQDDIVCSSSFAMHLLWRWAVAFGESVVVSVHRRMRYVQLGHGVRRKHV